MHDVRNHHFIIIYLYLTLFFTFITFKLSSHSLSFHSHFSLFISSFFMGMLLSITLSKAIILIPTLSLPRRSLSRSRSNSVTSIVSTYASSAEPLTSDFIFQPKERENNLIANTTFSKHPHRHGHKHHRQRQRRHHRRHSTPPVAPCGAASPSSELGSEQTRSTATDNLGLVSCSTSKRDEEEAEEPRCREVEEEDDDVQIVEEHEDEDLEETDSVSVNNNNNNTAKCAELGSGVSVASTSSGISSSRKRGKSVCSSGSAANSSPTPPPQPQPPPPDGDQSVKKRRPRKGFSAEIEGLLQYNRNMAPTTTKLPGRQTNNSLSSVTGPVILPFADTPTPPPTTTTSAPQASSKGGGGSAAEKKEGKDGKEAAAASGGEKNAAAGGGRKKKNKASEV